MASRSSNTGSFGGSTFMETMRLVEKPQTKRASFTSVDVLDEIAQKPQSDGQIARRFPDSSKKLAKLLSAGFITQDGNGVVSATTSGQAFLSKKRGR